MKDNNMKQNHVIFLENKIMYHKSAWGSNFITELHLAFGHLFSSTIKIKIN